MNLKEWGAHGRSWRGWERNDTNSVPIKFSKIKKSVFTGNIWQMAMLDWEKASGSDSSKGSAFLFTAGVSTGFYICFSWTTREGTMETSRATIYMCHGYLFVCGGLWMGQDTDDYETGSVGVVIQFYIHSYLEATLHWIALRPSPSSRPLASPTHYWTCSKNISISGAEEVCQLWVAEELALILGGGRV